MYSISPRVLFSFGAVWRLFSASSPYRGARVEPIAKTNGAIRPCFLDLNARLYTIQSSPSEHIVCIEHGCLALPPFIKMLAVHMLSCGLVTCHPTRSAIRLAPSLSYHIESDTLYLWLLDQSHTDLVISDTPHPQTPYQEVEGHTRLIQMLDQLFAKKQVKWIGHSPIGESIEKTEPPTDFTCRLGPYAFTRQKNENRVHLCRMEST